MVIEPNLVHDTEPPARPFEGGLLADEWIGLLLAAGLQLLDELLSFFLDTLELVELLAEFLVLKHSVTICLKRNKGSTVSHLSKRNLKVLEHTFR